jgi:Chaperone of endosialidase
MYKYIFSLILLSISCLLSAQNVGIGTAAPSASAQLHVSSNSKGLLIPQVSIDSLKDETSIPSPANGLIVYNTTEPGVRNDMARGYYWYSTNALTWVRFSDNLNDNPFVFGGTLGVKLRDTADAVEMLDNFTGSVTNFSPKVKILRLRDSALLNSKNNISSLVLTGINRKTTPGWEFRQKNSIIFENGYTATGIGTSVTEQVAAISAYTENPTTANVNDKRYNGLGLYTFSVPSNTASVDTPTVSLFYHNVGIGAYATDIKNVTEGRLQITGFSNGDQLSLRHPSSINLKWGLYVSSIDSSLNFYSNGSLRANIDRVTGVYSALSDKNMKKNIKPLSPVLDIIRQLPVYSYNYVDSKDDDRRVIGLMAQDVQPYFPELVYQRYDREITKPVLTMDYSGFGVVAIKAIQEQQKMIDELKQQVVTSKTTEVFEVIKKQQEVIQQLIKRIEQLESK